jgi:predicted nucleic acid-binding protein
LAKVVLDSNVFVAAGFNQGSSSAHLLAWVRASKVQMVWHDLTLAETRYQVEKIPPLAWPPLAGLFAPSNQVKGDLALVAYDFIEDRADRKFAALAEQANAILVTNDHHLLSAAPRLSVPVLTPRQAVAHLA